LPAHPLAVPPAVGERGKREHPRRPPGPPLRSQPGRHEERLITQTANAVEESQRQRQSLGVDPSRLLLLEMRLLQNAEREHLEKLGLQIVDEIEVRDALAQPHYALTLHFESEAALLAFTAAPDLARLGISGAHRQRASDSRPHPLRLLVSFADRETAKEFKE